MSRWFLHVDVDELVAARPSCCDRRGFELDRSVRAVGVKTDLE